MGWRWRHCICSNLFLTYILAISTLIWTTLCVCLCCYTSDYILELELLGHLCFVCLSFRFNLLCTSCNLTSCPIVEHFSVLIESVIQWHHYHHIPCSCLWYLRGLVPGPRSDVKIHRRSGSLHKNGIFVCNLHILYHMFCMIFRLFVIPNMIQMPCKQQLYYII